MFRCATFADASGKLRTLDRLIARLLGAGHRVVVFSQFTSTLDIIDDVLRMRDLKSSWRLDLLGHSGSYASS